MENKKVIFIRHNFSDSAKNINEYLWNNDLIAIHYDNIASINSEDYEKPIARDSIKRMVDYCKTGVIIAATYRNFQPGKIKIGEIERNSEIEFLNSWDAIQAGNFIYKTVAIKNPQVILYSDFPLLAAIQPQQVTLTGWPSATNYLNAIINNQPLERNVNFLTPGQLEVGCYEYLKMLNLVQVLLLPIGRTLMDIDIIGLDESGNKVFAQVTHSKNKKQIKKKIENLIDYQSNGNKLYFFGPNESKTELDGVEFITIDSVFEKLEEKKDSIQYKMISEMLKVP